MENQVQMVSADSRAFYEGAFNRLEGLVTKLKNAKTLLDYDNYQAALEDYAYTVYRVGGGSPEFEQKQNEMKQFFARSSKFLKTGGTALNPQSEPQK